MRGGALLPQGRMHLDADGNGPQPEVRLSDLRWQEASGETSRGLCYGNVVGLDQLPHQLWLLQGVSEEHRPEFHRTLVDYRYELRR